MRQVPEATMAEIQACGLSGQLGKRISMKGRRKGKLLEVARRRRWHRCEYAWTDLKSPPTFLLSGVFSQP